MAQKNLITSRKDSLGKRDGENEGQDWVICGNWAWKGALAAGWQWATRRVR